MHCMFHPFQVVLLVALSGMWCPQLTIYGTLKTFEATASSAVIIRTNFKMESTLPKLSGIVVSTKDVEYS